MAILLNEIMERLQMGRTEIMFKKVEDGSIRHMICTLNPKLAPRILLAKEERQTQEVISVWDLEKQGWRSFRVDSVLYLSEENHPIL